MLAPPSGDGCKRFELVCVRSHAALPVNSTMRCSLQRKNTRISVCLVTATVYGVGLSVILIIDTFPVQFPCSLYLWVCVCVCQSHPLYCPVICIIKGCGTGTVCKQLRVLLFISLLYNTTSRWEFQLKCSQDAYTCKPHLLYSSYLTISWRMCLKYFREVSVLSADG